MTTYKVTARRAGDWWALEVPELPGVFTQSKRLDSAPDAAREAIGLMLDVDPSAIDVHVEPQLTETARIALDHIATARAARKAAEEAERAAMRAAARTLTCSLTQRDAGEIIGVTFQRISQLLRESSAATPAIPLSDIQALLSAVRDRHAATSIALAAAWHIGSGNRLRALTDKRDDSLRVDDPRYLNHHESVA